MHTDLHDAESLPLDAAADDPTRDSDRAAAASAGQWAFAVALGAGVGVVISVLLYAGMQLSMLLTGDPATVIMAIPPAAATLLTLAANGRRDDPQPQLTITDTAAADLDNTEQPWDLLTSQPRSGQESHRPPPRRAQPRTAAARTVTQPRTAGDPVDAATLPLSVSITLDQLAAAPGAPTPAATPQPAGPRRGR